MTTYRELLQQVTAQVEQVDATEANALRGEIDSAAFVDVREQEEWEQGHITGALHIPRGNLESRIERALPDKDRPVMVYCASGNRSLFAAKTLEELGYSDVRSLSGGFADWKRNGFP